MLCFFFCSFLPPISFFKDPNGNVNPLMNAKEVNYAHFFRDDNNRTMIAYDDYSTSAYFFFFFLLVGWLADS
jgi:hypothetical protein